MAHPKAKRRSGYARAWVDMATAQGARGEDWLFPSRRRSRDLVWERSPTHLSARTLEVTISEAAGRAELDAVTAHRLRHTMGKRLADAGTPLDQIATILGHSRIETAALYTTPSAADLAAVAEKVAWE